MPVELKILALSTIVLLFTIIAATRSKTAQYGTKWNMGARDGAVPEPSPVTGRLMRAQANFFETFPIVIALIAILAISGRGNAHTALGACLWLGARVVYLPLYALGIPVVRSLAFLVSMAGIIMMLWPILFG